MTEKCYGELRRVATVLVEVDIAMLTDETEAELELRLADHVLDNYDVIETRTDILKVEESLCQPEKLPNG